jgi:hypothetical protein
VAEPRAESFARYLEAALDLLQVEAPAHFAATRARMRGRAAAIRVDDAPPLRLCFASGPPWISRRGALTGDIAVAISGRDLDRFLAGELTLEEGLADDRLRIQGDVDQVLDFLDALAAWLHGALRCPSFPTLQRAYLAEPHPDSPQGLRAGHSEGAPS